MNLKSLRVRNYRCIDDSGWVSVDDFTCLIGKNESGKTGFMRAVEKINPSYQSDGYTPYEEYPRREWPAYSDRHGDDPDVVASARFGLDGAEVEQIESAYGDGVLADREVVVHKDYQNELIWDLELDGSACDRYFSDGGASIDVDPDQDDTPSAEAILSAEIGSTILEGRLPEFHYVGEYSIMNGTIKVNELLERRDAGSLTPGDRAFLAVLSVAGLDLEEFEDVDDWRRKTTELETASNAISERVMRYWSQSGSIRIRIEAMAGSEADAELLEIRVEDRESGVTVDFEQRSHGFRRFFSVFSQLSELRRSDDDMVLLLDEPGLNLHARAKQQFRSFLRTELAESHPVVYTTHSPSMIDPETVHRTKMVMAEPRGETNVFTDITLADEYTKFPLRNVFEADLMDTLLVRPQTLLVEQKADHIYLYVVSKLLRDDGNDGLDDRWTVVPITAAENIDSFVSLFGEDALDVAALLNESPSRGGGGRGSGGEDDIRIRLVSEYSSSTDRSTIEDVFSDQFYLSVVNRTYSTVISEADRTPERITAEELGLAESETPIVRRLQAYFESHNIGTGEFDRREPALYLQRNRREFAEELDGETRRNFTRLFTDLNNILESFEGVEPRSRSILQTLGLG